MLRSVVLCGHGKTHTKGPSEPVEDDFPVEEVAAVKPKRKYTRRRQPIKKNDKEFVEPWTPEEEVALCKAWKRSYDSVNCKWKKRIRHKVSQFCEIYNSVKDMHQSGACDTTIYQEAEIEYRTIYHSAFALTESDSDDLEVQEVCPLGRDAAKKKRASSGARSESSVAGDPSLVDALISKFTMATTPFFSSRKESSSEYLRIK
uniref:Uncharacterized protein n=1 Tax=Tanacetum cinerariifolium TaxID=118510 RepID=A0A6L2KFN9_TANCI|nr:hypothetical protein [Tanacetum cinerariifolium]